MKGKIHGIGILMVLFGGAGLAEISTSNHGCFWFCVVLFAVGFALCLAGYVNDAR